MKSNNLPCIRQGIIRRRLLIVVNVVGGGEEILLRYSLRSGNHDRLRRKTSNAVAFMEYYKTSYNLSVEIAAYDRSMSEEQSPISRPIHILVIR